MFRKILTESFDRGRIDAQLHYHASAQPTDSGRLQPERVRVLREWAAAVQEISPESAPLSVAEVLNWSGVIIADSVDPLILVDQAQVLLQRTVSSLQSQRQREGKSLAIGIAKRVDECRRIAQGVQSMLGEIEAGFRQRLLERVAATFFSLSGADTTDALDEIRGEVAPKLSACLLYTSDAADE